MEDAEAGEKADVGERTLERGSPVLRGTNKVVGAVAHSPAAKGTAPQSFPVAKGTARQSAPPVAKGTGHFMPPPNPTVEIDVDVDVVAPPARGTGPFDLDPSTLPSSPSAKRTTPRVRVVEANPPVAESTRTVADSILPDAQHEWLLMLLETDAVASRTATEEALLALLHARKAWEKSSKSKGDQREFTDDFREKEVFARAALLSEAHAWRRLAVAAHLFASRFPGLQNHFATVAEGASKYEAIASHRLTRGFKPLSSRQAIDHLTPEKKSYEENNLSVAPDGQPGVTELDGDIEKIETNPEIGAATLDVPGLRHQPLIQSGVLLLILVLAVSVYLSPPNDASGEEIAVRALMATAPFVIVGGILGLVGALLGRREQSSW